MCKDFTRELDEVRLENCSILLSDPGKCIAECDPGELEGVILDCIQFADRVPGCSWMTKPLNEVLRNVRGARALAFIDSICKTFDSMTSLGRR